MRRRLKRPLLMARLHHLLLTAGMLALLAPGVQAQGSHYTGQQPGAAPRERAGEYPDSIYSAAYLLISDSEKLAAKQSYNAALQKGQQAERLLATLVRDYPDWNSNMVRLKRKLLAENMSIYRSKAGKSDVPTSRVPGIPTHAETGLADDPLSNTNYRPARLPNYATTDPKLYHQLATAQEEVRRIAQAYRELNERFLAAQKQLQAEKITREEYKKRYDQLNAALQDERKLIETERKTSNTLYQSLEARLGEMQNRYRAAESSLNESQNRVAELETRLAEVLESLNRVERERDSLLIENEKLRAIVELNSPEKTKALLDQNLTLAEQLKTARERISELEAMQSGASDENAVLAHQLEEARAEAARLRDEMSSIYDENMGFRRRVSELTQQLNNMEAELTSRAEQPAQDPALAQENKLLRAFIEKQRRKLAIQEESRRLLFETYRAMKNADPEVINIIQKMQDEDPEALTEEELKVLEEVRNNSARDNPEATEATRRKLEVDTLVGLANTAFSKGRYISAEQLYLTLYDLQPDNVAGLVNLGTILLYNSKNEEASEYLTRAARLSPKVAITHYLAGISFYRREQMQDAQKMFARAVQLDPGNAEAFFYLANIEGIEGAYDHALKHYAAAVKIRPELADAHYNMARLYAETNRVPEAARSYDRAVRNGSMPDPDFEAYLRQHPDNVKKPGADLVATIKPEDEARRLKPDDPQPPAPQQLPSSPGSDKQAAAFQERVTKITASPVEAVAEPSPAGAGHEWDPALFSTIRMRARSGMVELKVKRPEPRRLRTRGEGSFTPVKAASRP